MMNAIQKLIADRIQGKPMEDVSRLFFPKYWSLRDGEEATKEAELADALTEYDHPPCMSYYQ